MVNVSDRLSNKPGSRSETGPGRRKQVGIREIAREANVSVATVSMVLNENPRISTATRNRVSRVIKRLGYQPNRIAQSLSSKYTGMLAVLLPNLRHSMADPYFGELISGVSDKAGRLGHKLMLEHAKPEFIRQKRHLELFERRYIDGVLCIGVLDKHSFLADLVAGDYPAIVVNNTITDLQLDHVVCDYASGAEQIMTYLVQLGHRKIGMIHGTEDARTMRLMMDVYRRRMQQVFGGVDEALMVDGRFTEEHGYDAANRLIDRHRDMTAIFAANDKMAVGALHCAAHRGLKVPQDISIIGCDNITYSAFVNPSLTTVDTPLYEAGSLACERLIDRIRGNTNSVAEVLPTHLVLRESTGIANAARGS